MERIKNIVYEWLVRSGIVPLLLPLIKPYIMRCLGRPQNANFIAVDEGGCTLRMTEFDGKRYPPFGVQNFSKIKSFRIRDDDVLICGYPKSGCHWTFEIVSMILNKTTSVSKYGKELDGYIEFLPEFFLDSLPSPRVLNTHLPYEDLPSEIKDRKTKIVLTTRCPKDTVVSQYNHHVKLKYLFSYNGKFDDYFKLFMRGELDYGCYFKYQSDWKKMMTSPTTTNPILVISYEELKSDSVATIRKLARFLSVSVTEDFVLDIAKSTDFGSLKAAANKGHVASNLYRKGIIGDWKNWLTEAQSLEIDARLEETLGGR